MDQQTEPRRPNERRRWDEVNSLRGIGVLVVGGLFFGAIAVTRIVGAVEDQSLSATTIASLVLLAATFVLLVLWAWVTQKELGMLQEIGGPHIPPLPGRSLPLVVAAGVLLGSLGAATVWPVGYAVLYLGLKIVEVLGDAGIQGMVRRGLAGAQADASNTDHVAAINSLWRYYLQRPWRVLHAGGAGLALLALLLALIGTSAEGSRREVFDSGAYAVLIASILINETVVAAWRMVRTRELPVSYR